MFVSADIFFNDFVSIQFLQSGMEKNLSHSEKTKEEKDEGQKAQQEGVSLTISEIGFSNQRNGFLKSAKWFSQKGGFSYNGLPPSFRIFLTILSMAELGFRLQNLICKC